MARRITRADVRLEARDEVYNQRKRDATTGRELLAAALDLMLAEMTDLSKLNAPREDEACRDLARSIEAIAYETRKEADDERKNQITVRQQAHLQRR
ncbi:hypothetical protein AB0392_32265 [Nonomuraea angiospora]|uniref:hypothetical protein n=1 Tax=Nonomuraea angiospora TaxID=46172 RepID=UPI00344FF6EC